MLILVLINVDIRYRTKRYRQTKRPAQLHNEQAQQRDTDW
jgi:hypothetical protein